MGNQGSKIERDYPANGPFAGPDKLSGSLTPPKPLPADKKSVDRAVANLQRLTSFHPPTKTDKQPLEPVKIFHGESPETPPGSPVEQADFLHLVPVPKGRQPKKISPEWHSDPESFMGIAADPHKRTRALGSDAGHDKTVWSQKRRKNLRLPETALPFKDRLMAINALTPEDLIIIKEKLGYNPERIHQYAPLTQELILHRLHTYKDWMRNQAVKV